ncbi:hypothetical protein KAT80_01730 [Candidatus Pacearchaeota archaeon]|nr:hypothetical protein [Candidatus Pacearchaeota archaeon]
MVKIKGASAKTILDSRKEKTILISIKTNVGEFSASAPNGKSIGKYEKKIYKKNLQGDIETIKKFSDYFSEEVLEKFDDLRRIEDIVDRNIGANTVFALESAILKSMAKEQKKQVWELINSSSNRLPRLVGNCVGGGTHSNSERKPDFQEFLLIPKSKSVKESFEKNKIAKKEVEKILKEKNKNFKSKKNDENAWMTSLNEKEVLELLIHDFLAGARKPKFLIGIDVAASSFYKRKNYQYKNPLLKRTSEEQFGYLSNLIKNFNLFYIEDAFEENDFESHAKLLKKFPSSLIVGDDLVVTNYERFKKAIEMKSINAVIVKPNQIGSLLEVKRVCELAKKNNIKIVFSHRSGETEENILADLAFGFQADFFKCGIEGDVREGKIKRLIEIEKSLRR